MLFLFSSHNRWRSVQNKNMARKYENIFKKVDVVCIWFGLPLSTSTLNDQFITYISANFYLYFIALAHTIARGILSNFPHIEYPLISTSYQYCSSNYGLHFRSFSDGVYRSLLAQSYSLHVVCIWLLLYLLLCIDIYYLYLSNGKIGMYRPSY